MAIVKGLVNILMRTVKPAAKLMEAGMGKGDSRTRRGKIYQGSFGRIRAARLGPDGNLYIGTSNGSGDRIIRISPNPG